MSLLNRSASGTLVSLSACIANEARDRAKRLRTQMSVYCLEVRCEEFSIRVAVRPLDLNDVDFQGPNGRIFTGPW